MKDSRIFPNIIRGKRIEKDELIPIRHYLRDETIAYFPDISLFDISSAIGGAKELYQAWNSLKREEKERRLERLGEELYDLNDYDLYVARAGGFPIRVVEESRRRMGEYIARSSRKNLRNNPGKGIVVSATSVTTPEVQQFVPYEAILGNCSCIIKGDSKEPFSGFEFAEIAHNLGLPIEFITYNTKQKPEFGHKLYNACKEDGGFFVVMGSPETPKKIAYYTLLKYLESKGIEIDLKDLEVPREIINFVSHGAAIIVEEDADIENAVNGVIESFRYPRACMTPSCIYVSEKIYNNFKKALEERVKKIKIGEVEDYSTDFAIVDKEYWNIFVDPFIRMAISNGEIVYGDIYGENQQPIIIEGEFEKASNMEPHWPIFCLERYDNYKDVMRKINERAKNNPKGKILVLSVYTDNNTLLKTLEDEVKSGRLSVFTIHENLPTISVNPDVGHEGIILREYVSRSRFVNKKPRKKKVLISS
jgi:acyl-CoA reductase-like NAD-dependent aldehyde dehydrogenase